MSDRPTLEQILHTASGIARPMAIAHDEMTELLELIQNDGTIHDLDQYDEESMQTVDGSVLCGLMKRFEALQEEVAKLKAEKQ